jgi:hypothetical protein
MVTSLPMRVPVSDRAIDARPFADADVGPPSVR